jgi:hypothetical protein
MQHYWRLNLQERALNDMKLNISIVELMGFVASEEMFAHEIVHQSDCVINQETFAVTLAFHAGSRRDVLVSIVPKPSPEPHSPVITLPKVDPS